MPTQLMNVRIEVSDQIYIKDPYSSELGREILIQALPMIAELGMEKFTFRKLALQVNTTESAVYRYFENKHRLLLYYVSWYWGWQEYVLAFGTANIADPGLKLQTAIRILISGLPDMARSPFPLEHLQEVIISESSKAYFTKEVDDENKVGLFAQFKSLCNRVSAMILENAPDYPFARSLTSLFIESHLSQLFFKAHLPSLTNLGDGDDTAFEFFNSLILNSISPWKR